MELSYNGWTASKLAKDFGGLDNRLVLGSKDVRLRPGIRAGDVATVLFYVAAQLHARVESGDMYAGGDEWGYSYRLNRNANNLSCHSSATAFDWNATRHPNGKRGTFTKAQVAEIRKILAEVGGIVRWGGDFTGTPDEMHFEIVASPATVGLVAQRLTRTGGTGSPITTLPVPEDDMPYTLDQIAKAVWEYAAVGRPSGNLAAAKMLDLIDQAGGKILAAVDAVPAEVWDHEVPRPGTTPMRAGELLGYADRAASLAANVRAADPAAVAAELLPGLIAALPAQQASTITVADIETGLRNVLRAGTDG